MMSWTAYVQQDGDDLVLPLPDEAMGQLGWKVGDVLVWNVQEDGTVILTKKTSWYFRVWSKIRSWRNK
jgi:antitoxin component of MazEF toxin-antitoxin module